MKGLAVLVFPWFVAATEQFSTLRDDFCIDATKPDCREAVVKCRHENKSIGGCIRHEHAYCIQGESSPCAETVAQCINEFSTGNGADEAVKGCIVQRLISGPAANGGTSDEQAASDILTGPEQVASCEQLSLDFEQAWFTNNCDGAGEGGSETPETMSRLCEQASATFEQAWLENNCEAVLNDAVGNVLT